MSEKSQAYQEFVRLTYSCQKKLLRSMYQGDEVEKSRNKVWNISDITDSDVEKVICSGIPVNKMGNLKEDVGFNPGETFQSEAISADRESTVYLNHKFPVERFDLITSRVFYHFTGDAG